MVNALLLEQNGLALMQRQFKGALDMAAFTIFRNTKTGKCVAVYDSQLPTQTGIGEKEEWIPVHHGQAVGFLDKVRQRKEFEERSKRHETK